MRHASWSEQSDGLGEKIVDAVISDAGTYFHNKKNEELGARLERFEKAEKIITSKKIDAKEKIWHLGSILTENDVHLLKLKCGDNPVVLDLEKMIRPKNVGLPYKNSNDKIIGGVCSGIAEKYRQNSIVVRAACILSLFLLGPLTFLLYILLWVAMPSRDDTIPIAYANHKT